MSDLKQYLSLQSRIDELEKEVERLRRSNDKFKDEMNINHKKELDKAKKQTANWKFKYNKLKNNKSPKVTRTSKAILEMKKIKKDGFEGKAIRQIENVAKNNFMSVTYTKNLWDKVKINE